MQSFPFCECLHAVTFCVGASFIKRDFVKGSFIKQGLALAFFQNFRNPPPLQIFGTIVIFLTLQVYNNSILVLVRHMCQTIFIPFR